jgi:hypothetical protein
MEIDTLEYSRIKATLKSMRLQIYLSAALSVNACDDGSGIPCSVTTLDVIFF